MNTLEYLLLFVSVIFGGGLAFYFQRKSESYLKWVLSFSGAYILGISVLHLMPTVFSQGNEKIGLWILLGFVIQLMLEQLSGGVEHGHIHAHEHARPSFAIQIMLGLCIHAFIEGMPLGNYKDFHNLVTGHNHDHSGHLLWGIIMHKAPAAFALVLLLLQSSFRTSFVVSCLVLFAIMSPSGAALSEYLFSAGLLSADVLQKIIAVVVGSFLHISTTIIFEVDNSAHHQVSRSKLLAIILGLAGAILTI